MSNTELLNLLKKQAEQRKDLAAGVYREWQSIKEREQELLTPFEGKYENASDLIRQEINGTREKFFQEWGSDGKLAILMDVRHGQERQKLATEQGKEWPYRKEKDRGR
jgi:hypothetical protein